jgi:uncharacterized OB-fold protein
VINMSSDLKVEGDFPIHFRYTAGLAGEKFLREIKDNGRLVAARCTKCDLNYLPPRIYCERCMSRLEDYVTVENTGTVETFTICTQDSDGRDLPQPTTVALVRFPSAHGGLVHKVKSEVSVGDKVRVVFREKSKRVGSILDIEYLERIT